MSALLTKSLADSFADSELFGAPLRGTFIDEFNSLVADQSTDQVVTVIAAVMVILMTVSQFITQLQIMAKNMSPEAKNSPMFRQQKILLYILPLVFAVSGCRLPPRRDVLLADLQLLDDDPAVHRHPEHADTGQRGGEGP